MDFSHWIDKDRKDGGRRTREWFGKGSVLVLRSQVTGSELSCSKEGNIGAKGSKQEKECQWRIIVSTEEKKDAQIIALRNEQYPGRVLRMFNKTYVQGWQGKSHELKDEENIDNFCLFKINVRPGERTISLVSIVHDMAIGTTTKGDVESKKTAPLRKEVLFVVHDVTNRVASPIFVLKDEVYKMGQHLAKKYAPIIQFHSDEQYFPCSPEWFIRRTQLCHINEKGKTSVILPNIASVENLFGVSHEGEDTEAMADPDSLYPTQTSNFYLNIPASQVPSHDLPPLEAEQQYGSSCAYGQWREIDQIPVYVRIILHRPPPPPPPSSSSSSSSSCSSSSSSFSSSSEGGGGERETWLDIQYWFFFPYHGAVHHFFFQSVQTFQGEWQHVTIRLRGTPVEIISGGSPILGVWMDAHATEGKWYVAPINEKEKEGYQLVDDCRPLVFCSRKTHAFYPNEGVHVRKRFVGLVNDHTNSQGYRWDTGLKLKLLPDIGGLSEREYKQSDVAKEEVHLYRGFSEIFSHHSSSLSSPPASSPSSSFFSPPRLSRQESQSVISNNLKDIFQQTHFLRFTGMWGKRASVWGERDGFYGPGLMGSFVDGDPVIDYSISEPCELGNRSGCGLDPVDVEALQVAKGVGQFWREELWESYNVPDALTKIIAMDVGAAYNIEKKDITMIWLCNSSFSFSPPLFPLPPSSPSPPLDLKYWVFTQKNGWKQWDSDIDIISLRVGKGCVWGTDIHGKLYQLSSKSLEEVVLGRGYSLSWALVPLPSPSSSSSPSSSPWFVSSFDVCDWSGDIFAIFTKKEEIIREEIFDEEGEEEGEGEGEEGEEKGKEEGEEEGEGEIKKEKEKQPQYHLHHRFGKIKLREWKNIKKKREEEQENGKGKLKSGHEGEAGGDGRRMWSSMELPDLSHQMGDNLSDLQKKLTIRVQNQGSLYLIAGNEIFGGEEGLRIWDVITPTTSYPVCFRDLVTTSGDCWCLDEDGTVYHYQNRKWGTPGEMFQMIASCGDSLWALNQQTFTDPPSSSFSPDFSPPSPPICSSISLTALSVQEVQFGIVRNYEKIWASESLSPAPSAPVTFWRGIAPPSYYLLGHLVEQSLLSSPFSYSLAIKEVRTGPFTEKGDFGDERTEMKLFAYPESYELVWHINTSSGSLGIWSPTPPEGYQAMGHVVSFGKDLVPPKDTEVVCLHPCLLSRGELNKSKIWDYSTNKKNPNTQAFFQKIHAHGEENNIPPGTFICSFAEKKLHNLHWTLAVEER